MSVATKAIPNDLQPTREGDHLMITLPNYWGKGVTIKDAKHEVKIAGGDLKNNRWRVYSVHPEAYVDGMGTIYSKTDHQPEMLAEHNPPA